jgi:replicative DNA helicase
MNSVPSTEPFKTYEKYIMEAWKLREAKRIQGTEMTSVADIDRVIEKYVDLACHDQDEAYDHTATMVEMYQKINEQEVGISGLDTGFRDLNDYLDGFQNKELIISAARPSVGKTAKMISHALTHCANGGVTVIFSLEMDKESLIKRMVSSIGKIDGFKMKNPKSYFNKEDWEKFTTALGILGKMNLHLYDDAGQTVPQMRAKVNQLKRKFPGVPLLVQIDYLQLIRPTGKRETRTIEIGEMTRSLKALAKDADVPVYLVSQLSRGVESRQDKRPRMSDIRDSGSVEQDADVIEFLYRDDYYDREAKNENIVEVIIAKHRNGPVGTVKLAYAKEYNVFVDMEEDVNDD